MSVFLFHKILLYDPVPPAPRAAAGSRHRVAVELQQVAEGHFVEEGDEAEGGNAFKAQKNSNGQMFKESGSICGFQC